jgi:hypothetical protein
MPNLLRKYELPTQVNSDQTGWHDLSQRSGCSGSPVAALGYPTLVAESLHQFTPCEGDARHVPAGFGWLVRKSKSWKRRNDNMERILYATAIICGVSKGPNDLDELRKSIQANRESE